MKTPAEIAEKLKRLLTNLEFLEAYETLFSVDAESFDPLNPLPSPIKGLAGLIDREKEFLSRSKIHSLETSETIHSGSYFSFKLLMKFSIDGKELELDELCVYKVSQGLIVSQQFFIG